MQTKKILEEMEQYRRRAVENGDFNVAAAHEKDMNIIRKHMNDGWIPVEERLPEISRTPEEDDECPEFNVTIRRAEEATTLKYSPADSTWFDDNGYVYDVIAWRPLPEPYRPEPETEKPDWRQDMLRKFDRRTANDKERKGGSEARSGRDGRVRTGSEGPGLVPSSCRCAGDDPGPGRAD